ncbi:hypothetical protein SBA1_90059 [Candidatus Sulfotelmatobacter kueseliae]|uniref:DUF2059 domain-containing protein n=1 Tax=Candidatus Sulfotelmatobacter kueseliae TaxID=2042962 RepID=A0A2U3LAI5_9BACT|nr:hypothetical protein SBA1_90059 [Candidatus Sulfotelmatobacter kueseliae]
MWENAVSVKALARREPYPPAKSDAPHRKNAATEPAAGANWVNQSTRDEGNTGRAAKADGAPDKVVAYERPVGYAVVIVEAVMKPVLIALACLAFVVPAFAQTAEEPASRDDVILLLRTMGSHDTMRRTMEAMLKPMHQMYHEQYVKEKDKLPPDFELRMDKMMDEMMKNMPLDEIMQAMVPAYQKHFTHGDIEALNAFYSSPVGQKFLEQSPAVTAEAMQAMIPIMTKYGQQWQGRMQQEVQEMEKEPPKKTGAGAASQN